MADDRWERLGARRDGAAAPDECPHLMAWAWCTICNGRDAAYAAAEKEPGGSPPKPLPPLRGTSLAPGSGGLPDGAYENLPHASARWDFPPRWKRTPRTKTDPNERWSARPLRQPGA